MDGKGVVADSWVVKQMLRDIDDCGVNVDGLVIKCDQEPAICESKKNSAGKNKR